ncbi:MAG: hypothetical protein EOP33_01375 [Rickettsiaceae bacterium]|nr:MAG: hypothetical protein EOP33_01375 [Rickettsiaceae bacterium]
MDYIINNKQASMEINSEAKPKLLESYIASLFGEDKYLNFNIYNNSDLADLISKLESIDIYTVEEVEIILQALRVHAARYGKIDGWKSPINILFNILNDRCNKVLPLVHDQILTTVENIYSHLSSQNQTIALQTIYIMQHFNADALKLFVKYFADPKNIGLNNTIMYHTINSFKEIIPENIDWFVNNLTPILAFEDFRAVAVLELFSHYVANNVIKEHPIKDNLIVIERWLDNISNPEKFSYAISGCAALSLVNSPQSILLLKRAAHHPDLNIQLEAVFAQIILNVNGSHQLMIDLLLNPKISIKAHNYVNELAENYKIKVFIPSYVDKKIRSTVFEAIAVMCSWLNHEREYGRAPDTIAIWDKQDLLWPTTGEIETVYLLKYSYTSYEYKSKPDVDKIGFCILKGNNERVYSMSKNYSDKMIAYADYLRHEYDIVANVPKDHIEEQAAYADYLKQDYGKIESIDDALRLLYKLNPHLTAYD